MAWTASFYYNVLFQDKWVLGSAQKTFERNEIIIGKKNTPRLILLRKLET